MSGIKNYLLSMAASAFLLSLVLAVLPKGKIHRISRFAGALLLILAVIAPIARIDADDISQSIAKFQMQTQQLQTGIEVRNREILSQLIKEQCQAYILDKAEAMGVSVSVEISLSEERDYPYPVSVVLQGNVSPEDRGHLERIIEQDIGIPPERQEWK